MSAAPLTDTPPRSRAAKLLYGGVPFALLAFVLPVYAIPGLSVRNSTVALALVPMVWAAARVSLLLANGVPRLLTISMWTFTYSFLTLPWVAQVSRQQYPLGTSFSYNDASASRTTLIVVLGIAAFEVGYAVSARRHGFAPVAPEPDGPAQLPNISVRASFVLAYVGLAFVLLAIARYGFGSFFVSRTEFTQNFAGDAYGTKFYLNDNKAAGNALLLISQVPVFIGTYLLLYLQHAARKLNGVRLMSWWGLAPLLIANVVINNPISNPRSWYGTVIIGFASIYLPFREKRGATRTFILIYVAISIFSFHQLAAFRNTDQRDFKAIPVRTSLIADPDFGSPQQIQNAVVYVDGSGFRLGRQLEGTALVWYPHKLWVGKPGDTGQLVGGSAGFKVAAPLWAEGFVDFGLLGVITYLAAIASLVRRLDDRYLRSRAAPNLVAALTPVMASLLVFVLRGSLQPAFGLILPVVLCILYCLKLRRRRVPAQPSSPRNDLAGRQVASRLKYPSRSESSRTGSAGLPR